MTNSKLVRFALASTAAAAFLGLGAGQASAQEFAPAPAPAAGRPKVECQPLSSNQSICKITVWGNEYVVLCDKKAQTCQA